MESADMNVNFCDMKKEDFDAVKAQIALYKEWRKVLQTGSFLPGKKFFGSGQRVRFIGWKYPGVDVCIRRPGKAVGFLMQKLVSPNTQFEYYRSEWVKPGSQISFLQS